MLVVRGCLFFLRRPHCRSARPTIEADSRCTRFNVNSLLIDMGDRDVVAKLKADAQKVVSVISGDKAKTQTYCQIAKISKQVDQAAQEKDTKKGEGLVQKINELEKQLGPEYLALVDALFNNNNMDLNSEDFEEIVSMFDRFDESCRH